MEIINETTNLIGINLIGKNSLDKHMKYENTYKKDELYWGIGIENELYLEFENYINFEKTKFLKNHKRERYSVDYYTNYKNEYLETAFKIFSLNYNEKLPLLLNCHSMTRTDKSNNSKTLYTKLCEPNPKFDGETLWEFILKNNEYLKNNFDKSFTFDGDTFEIITLNFYNTTVNNVIEEYIEYKNDFITNLQNVFNEHNIFSKYGKIDFMKDNHPFAIHLTNINNVGIFNNGTIHFNITLPTKLNSDGFIYDKISFINIHKNYIKLIQFMEPYFLCVYGSPDPFSNSKLSDYDDSHLFSSSSQRGAVSRYIGIGTYNTDIMKPGKLLIDDINTFDIFTNKIGWYNNYYKNCAYNKLENLGYDINFNKHYNHGVEIRFFDHINDENIIKEVLKHLIYLGDFSLENDVNINPILNKNWNKLIIKCMKHGKNTILNEKEINLYNILFNNKFISTNIVELYYEIISFISSNTKSTFSKLAFNNNENISNENINQNINENTLIENTLIENTLIENINTNEPKLIEIIVNDNINNNIINKEKIIKKVKFEKSTNTQIEYKNNSSSCCMIL
jgi:hypothetical protein